MGKFIPQRVTQRSSEVEHLLTGSPRVLECPGKSPLSLNILEMSWNSKVSWKLECPGKLQLSWKTVLENG